MSSAAPAPEPPDAIPAVIVGGYLGVGKTTLVNHLLRNAGGRRIAVLVNDFGDISIDADLIEGADGEVLSLAGGCVCCSFGSDLVGAVMEMRERQPPPDMLLIETSGVGLPAAVAQSVQLVSGIEVDGIVVVCDAREIQSQVTARYVGSTVSTQLQQANLLLLNKADSVEAERLTEIGDWLQVQNPNVTIVIAEWCAVPADAILGIGPSPTSEHPEAAHSVGSAETLFETEHLHSDDPIDIPRLLERLSGPGSRVVRVKGWLTDVSGQQHLLQGVGRQMRITPVPLGKLHEPPSELIVIRTCPNRGQIRNPEAH